MNNDNLQGLLKMCDQKDEQISGIIVFDMDSGKSLASTFSSEYDAKTIAIEQALTALDEDRIMKLDPVGPKNWAMYSYDRKVVATVKIRGSIWLSCEYKTEKAPSAAIEDALEIALMANDKL
ncbi:hypothetical protein JXA59_03310 [Patescibacteria group bacterium]|nr:hypothetical protein [Patescibacteria group bacterium]